MDGHTAEAEGETFYAGIFYPDGTLFDVIELVQNAAVITEVPLGGDDGMSPITYTVMETDADGIPVEGSEFAWNVTVSGDVTLSLENLHSSVEITNEWSEPETEIETETETETETGTKTGIQTESGKNDTPKGVQTGDDTSVETYAVLILGATLVLIVLEERRRRARR